MANKRQPFNPLLKSLPDSDKFNAVSIGAGWLYCLLHCHRDDGAHYWADPKMVLAKLLTKKWMKGEVDEPEVASWIGELERESLIFCYTVNGCAYLEITNCVMSLRSDVKPDVRFPYPLVSECGTNAGRMRNESGTLTQPNPTQPNPTDPVPSAGADDAPQADAEKHSLKDGPVGFARWWAAWPTHFRKRGRAKCLRHWNRVKLEQIAEQVIACLGRCKASHEWRKNERQFIPMPMTWLNQTPWETVDDAAEKRPTAPDGAGKNSDRAEWLAHEKVVVKYLAEMEPTDQDLLVAEYKREREIVCDVKLSSAGFRAWLYERISQTQESETVR